MTQVKKTEGTEIAAPQEAHLPADPMVSMIERVAMDPDADINKLERMLEMKERLERDAAQRDFNEALASAQAEMPSVVARHDNKQTSSKFAKLKDIYEACKPVAAKHGFSFNAVPVAGGRDGFMNMKWTLRRGAHIESDVSEVPIDDKGMKGTANKTGTHAYGSTTSYGRRYLFCAVFDIAIGDDNDGNEIGNAQPVSEEQFRELQDLIEKAGITDDVVCKAEKLNALHELPANRFDAVKGRLQITIKHRAGQK